MVASITRAGRDDTSERDLLVIDAPTVADIPSHLFTGSQYFTALIAWNAEGVPSSQVASLTDTLLAAGCVYFCCWGPGCERVHDLIDETYGSRGTPISDDASTIMTTWHNDISLEEAAWFSINVAIPDDRFFDGCRSVLAICIGNSTWAAQLRTAFADTNGLSQRVAGDGAA